MLNVLPSIPSVPDADTRANLIGLAYEENRELQKALIEGNLEKVVDACADLITIVIGIALQHGVDITPHMAEVALANMEKKPADGKGFGRMTKDGQSTKANWTEPRIKAILAEQTSGALLLKDIKLW
jgi:predicted HAD superfamily Cof-like phosphohydrolase